MRRTVINALFVALLFMVGTASAWQHISQAEADTMTLETYQLELQASIDKRTALEADIAKEQVAIDSLKQLLIDLDKQIAAVIQEKYDILGITEADIIAAEQEISEIRRNLELLLGLSSEELFKRKSEIDENEARINALKAKPVSLLWKIRDQIKTLDSLLERVKANLPDVSMSYEVQSRVGKKDCLYRIAGYEEVYSDATKWPELYRANKSEIDRGYNRYRRYAVEPKYDRPQDLIFPGQTLDIPR